MFFLFESKLRRTTSFSCLCSNYRARLITVILLVYSWQLYMHLTLRQKARSIFTTMCNLSFFKTFQLSYLLFFFFICACCIFCFLTSCLPFCVKMTLLTPIYEKNILERYICVKIQLSALVIPAIPCVIKGCNTVYFVRLEENPTLCSFPALHNNSYWFVARSYRKKKKTSITYVAWWKAKHFFSQRDRYIITSVPVVRHHIWLKRVSLTELAWLLLMSSPSHR